MYDINSMLVPYKPIQFAWKYLTYYQRDKSIPCRDEYLD